MSAVDRLAAALYRATAETNGPGDPFRELVVHGFPEDASASAEQLLAADPHLAQDIEDGRALRELREADDVIEPHDIEVSEDPDDAASVRFMVRVLDTDAYGMGSTIAAAADKAREALR